MSLAGAIKGQYTTTMSSAGWRREKATAATAVQRVSKNAAASRISAGIYCIRARDKLSLINEENNNVVIYGNERKQMREYSRLPYNASSYNANSYNAPRMLRLLISYNAILHTTRQIIKHRNYLHFTIF